MSKPYLIRVAETVRRHVVVSDGVETRLDLLEILPCEDLSRLLEEELKKRGFVVEAGVATRTEEDGVVIRIEIDSRKVHVGKHEEKDVEHTIERTIRSYQQDLDPQAVQRIREEAEQTIEASRERQRRAFTAEIEKKLGDVRAELDTVVVAVTQQALRRRAAQIGEVQSIEEDPNTGSMTIRVRV